MTSPFKLLDAFAKEDKDLYFGRQTEIDQLYRLVFEGNLVLVYGASGTGKTSLIRCGLANRFAETDWFQVFVRRSDDINKALDREIALKAIEKVDGKPPVEALNSLYLDHLKPIYLIFDQFEELFILGHEDEQRKFFATVAAILASTVSCKIIFILREEYLAQLHHFEEAVPALFAKRLRVEPMTRVQLTEVVTGMTAARGIALEHGADTARLIIDQLDDGTGVQLAYLQVYLDKLYRRAEAEAAGGPVSFTDADVAATGKLGDLLAGYLTEQIDAVQALVARDIAALPAGGVRHLLEEFVTASGTKRPTSRDELVARIPDIAEWADPVLDALKARRILRLVDGRYELAHDALAAPLAENRSTERKAMQIAREIVADRIAKLDTTKTWLNPEELAVVSRARRQTNPLTGHSLLELSPEEEKFVARSRTKKRWRTARRALALVGLTTAVFLGSTYLAFSIYGPDFVVAANNETDWLAYRTYSFLRIKDDTSAEALQLRHDLLQGEHDLNAGREDALGINYRFWDDLLKADLARDSGDEDAALAQYRKLEKEQHAAIYGDEGDLYDWNARVRLKALLWRLDIDEGKERAEAMQQILDVVAFDPDNAVPNFKRDVRDVCAVLTEFQENKAIKQVDARCRDPHFLD